MMDPLDVVIMIMKVDGDLELVVAEDRIGQVVAEVAIEGTRVEEGEGEVMGGGGKEIDYYICIPFISARENLHSAGVNGLLWN